MEQLCIEAQVLTMIEAQYQGGIPTLAKHSTVGELESSKITHDVQKLTQY